MNFRKATSDDLDLLANWNHQLIADEGHRNPMGIAELKERMETWLSGEYEAVVFSEERDVAYVLFKETESEIYLRQLFVIREKRRQGIGRKAMSILFGTVWPQNKRLTVDVLSGNPEGIHFWKLVGYRDYCRTLEILPESIEALQRTDRKQEMERIETILEFVIEVEKLKSVLRKTRPVGLDRFENSAEHSWHVCLCALMLKDHANDPIDIDRVLKMLLIHDLCEIDAGDTIVYASDTEEVKTKERAGIKRVLGILPEGLADPYINLWTEFEEGVTADAAYAKAIDRLPPLLHNLHGHGHSWREHGISLEKILAVNSRIGKGSDTLWKLMKGKIESAVRDGLFEDSK
jgi:putative hydrolase of HD superfamily